MDRHLWKRVDLKNPTVWRQLGYFSCDVKQTALLLRGKREWVVSSFVAGLHCL